MSTEAVADRVRAFFKDYPGTVYCRVHLSLREHGTREAHPDSDLDIAVLFETDPPSTLADSGVRLAGALERHLGRPVDLVVLNRAPVDLVHRVLGDGIVVFDRGPSTRIRFEIKARNLYCDLLPVLQRYPRAPEGG